MDSIPTYVCRYPLRVICSNNKEAGVGHVNGKSIF
jgi:hypothetical protein